MLILVGILALALDLALMMVISQWHRISRLEQRCLDLERERSRMIRCQVEQMLAEFADWERRRGS